jgi:hypothetical protein
MPRERLPNRRPGVSFEITHPGLDEVPYDVTAGFDASGRIREVFISCRKTTTAMDIAARDVATLVSIALQHGASLQELAGSVTRGDKGEPQGIAGAVLDELATFAGHSAVAKTNAPGRNSQPHRRTGRPKF